MQQTEKYKLNLIETSDTFSPVPLNENMEKVEAALEAKAGVADMEQRLTVLEAHKLLFGGYGGGGDKTIEIGETPKLVILHKKGYGNVNSFLCEACTSHGHIVDNGFFLIGSSEVNRSGNSYLYIAFI